MAGWGVLLTSGTRLSNRSSSDRALTELVRLFGDPFSYQQAQIHPQRGEADLAFKALRRALEVKDPGLLAIRVDPFLDPLRSDPRLKASETALRFP